MTLGEFPEDDAKLAAKTPDHKQKPAPIVVVGELGMALSTLTPALREQFKLEDTVKGVVVTKIMPKGPAAEKGIPAGAIIRKIGPDQQVVTTPDQVQKKIEQAKRAKLNTILVLIESGGVQRFVALNITKG